MAEFRFSEEPSLGAVVNPSYKVFCNWSPKTPIKSVYKITRDVCGHKFSTICGFTFTSNLDVPFFVKNPDWVDTVKEKADTGYDIYQIPGILVNVNSALKQDPTANYKNFKAGKTDTSGIPSSVAEQEAGDKPYKYFVEGDSVWKLQVNALNQAEWENIFKAGGEVMADYQTPNEADYYQCKPIMSNDDFINGVYTSINRVELANLVSAN